MIKLSLKFEVSLSQLAFVIVGSAACYGISRCVSNWISSDTQANDKDVTDDQKNDKDATYAQESNKDATDTQENDKDATDTQENDKDATDSQENDKDATYTQENDKEVTDSLENYKDATDTHSSDEYLPESISRNICSENEVEESQVVSIEALKEPEVQNNMCRITAETKTECLSEDKVERLNERSNDLVNEEEELSLNQHDQSISSTPQCILINKDLCDAVGEKLKNFNCFCSVFEQISDNVAIVNNKIDLQKSSYKNLSKQLTGDITQLLEQFGDKTLCEHSDKISELFKILKNVVTYSLTELKNAHTLSKISKNKRKVLKYRLSIFEDINRFCENFLKVLKYIMFVLTHNLTATSTKVLSTKKEVGGIIVDWNEFIDSSNKSVQAALDSLQNTKSTVEANIIFIKLYRIAESIIWNLQHDLQHIIFVHNGNVQ